MFTFIYISIKFFFIFYTISYIYCFKTLFLSYAILTTGLTGGYELSAGKKLANLFRTHWWSA